MNKSNLPQETDSTIKQIYNRLANYLDALEIRISNVESALQRLTGSGYGVVGSGNPPNQTASGYFSEINEQLDRFANYLIRHDSVVEQLGVHI